MPEDYQAILEDLGVDVNAPANNNAEATPNTEDTTNNTPANTTTSTEPATPAASTTTTTDNTQANSETDNSNDEQHRTNEAFAAMRSENTKYKKFLQHIMKGANFQGDEAAFMESLTEASYKRQAQQQGNQVSPEVLRRMDTLEAQNRSLIDAQNRQLFTANLKGLQDTLSLKDSDLKEFVDLAVQENIDLTVPGTNFVTLYQGLFYDKLKARDIEAARQEWIAQNSKADGAAKPDGKSGKKDPTPTNVNTMAEFDSLLQSIPTNK